MAKSAAEWGLFFANQLDEEVLPWWREKSIDADCGGFHSCIDAAGDVFDDTKYVWLQGRQIWTFATLAARNGGCRRDLAIAKAGVEFLDRARRDDGSYWFAVDRRGDGVVYQRKPWGGVFACMAAVAVARAGLVLGDGAGESRLQIERACDAVVSTFAALDNSGALARDKFGPGHAPATSLAVPLISLNVCHEFALLRDAAARSASIGQPAGAMDAACAVVGARPRQCVAALRRHVLRDASGAVVAIPEELGVDGRALGGARGRHANPGHVFEAAWFLLQWAETGGRVWDATDAEVADARALALEMIDWTDAVGWDERHGGYFYFVDTGPASSTPLALEWDMKLWWVHCEALVALAFAMRVAEPGRQRDHYTRRFDRAARYVRDHFVDSDRGGEWYAYLNRSGERTHTLKAGPYKGCFHVPRALWTLVELLKRDDA